MLYRKDAGAVARRQMAMSSSENVILNLPDVSERTGHPLGTLNGPETQRKLRERSMTSKNSEAWWNNETSQLPKTFAELIQIHSVKTAAALKFKSLVAYIVHVMWLNATERRRRGVIDRRYTLLEILSAGTAELEVEDGDLEVDKIVSSQWSAMSDVTSLVKPILQTS